MMLSFMGGVIGIGAGITISFLISAIAKWAVSISAGSIILAFGFAIGIGIFFGYYPARKAADMDPIEALRYE